LDLGLNEIQMEFENFDFFEGLRGRLWCNDVLNIRDVTLGQGGLEGVGVGLCGRVIRMLVALLYGT
jgi:hypothetical protein